MSKQGKIAREMEETQEALGTKNAYLSKAGRKVRSLLAHYLPGPELEEYGGATVKVDALQREMWTCPAEKCWRPANDYAHARLELYRQELSLLSTIDIALQAKLATTSAALSSLYQEKDGIMESYKQVKADSWATFEVREKFMEDVREANKKIEKEKERLSQDELKKAIKQVGLYMKVVPTQARGTFPLPPEKQSFVASPIAPANPLPFSPVDTGAETAIRYFADCLLAARTDPEIIARAKKLKRIKDQRKTSIAKAAELSKKNRLEAQAERREKWSKA